jgi:hypothetical protein
LVAKTIAINISNSNNNINDIPIVTPPFTVLLLVRFVVLEWLHSDILKPFIHVFLPMSLPLSCSLCALWNSVVRR